MATATPSMPPWKLMPPCQTSKICGGMGEVELRLVEQHVAEAAAQDHAERRPGEEVVHLHGVGDLRRLQHQAAHQAPAEHQTEDIGQGIPTDAERAELDGDRVKLRIEQDGKHAGLDRSASAPRGERGAGKLNCMGKGLVRGVRAGAPYE